MADNHSFSVDIAAKEGLIEAILLQHIKFLQVSFLEKDELAESVWIRRSVRAYRETYPYLTDKKISGALDRMEERDLIRSKIENKVAYDRTKSVQLAKKGWGYFRENAFDKKENGKDERENGFAQNGESLQGSYSSFVDSFIEGERTPPAPNPSNLKEEKNESGLVAPGRVECDGSNGVGKIEFYPAAENPETVKAEIPPTPNSAAPPSPENQLTQNCPECRGMGDDDYGHICSYCKGSGQTAGTRAKLPTREDLAEQAAAQNEFVNAVILHDPEFPGVTIVEAAPKLQPLPRVATTIEAETKISEWIAGEGLETVKHRFSIAKQRFDPDNAAAIAAHYCSVYTKNAANKGRLLADPITHFSDGLFSYLKNEESWGRNNTPRDGSPTRTSQQSQKANLNHLGANPGGYEEKQAF